MCRRSDKKFGYGTKHEDTVAALCLASSCTSHHPPNDEGASQGEQRRERKKRGSDVLPRVQFLPFVRDDPLSTLAFGPLRRNLQRSVHDDLVQVGVNPVEFVFDEVDVVIGAWRPDNGVIRRRYSRQTWQFIGSDSCVSLS